MADYKIKLGVDLKVNDIRKRISEYNKNTNNAKLHLGIKLDTDDLKKQINNLNIGGIGKGKGIAIPVNTQSLETSLKEVKDIIADIKSSLGTLDGGDMKSLLSSVNQIATALGKAESESDNLVKSLNALSKKDFNINLGIDMNKKGLNTIGYGRAARKQVIPELEAQIKYLENLFGGQQATMNKLASQGSKVGFDVFTDFGDFNSDSAIKKMEAMEKYINSLKKLAAIDNVNLDGFNEIHKDASALINDITGIESAVDKAGDVPEKLKNLFGGNIDAEGLSASLKPIVDDLGEIKAAIQGLSSGVSLEGLTQSFDRLSSSIELLIKNCTTAKKAINDSVSNVGKSVGQGGSESAIKETSNELIKLKNLAHKIGQLDFKIVKSDYNDEIHQVKEFERQLELLKTQYNETINNLNSKGIDINSEDITREFVDARNKIAEFEAKVKDTKAELAKNIKLKLDDGNFNVIEKINREVSKLTGNYPKLTATITEVENALREMEAAAGTEDEILDINKLISAYEKFIHALKNANNQLKENRAQEKYDSDAENLDFKKDKVLSEINGYLQGNTRAAREFGEELRDLARRIDACDDSKAFTNLNAELGALKSKINTTLKGDTKSFGDKIKKQWQQYSSYLSVASLFQYAEQGLRSMFEQVKLIDSAMTELKKVTNETDASYNQFLTNAATRSREIGTTIDGLVSSTADFARLGYGFEDAQGLAEVANIYAVVGDEVEGVEGATESLISTMAAFKDEMNGMSNTDFAMSIIDKFNEIGNNFAISSGGIGEALERSASSLMAANNTIDESIALITAANTVVQDPDAVGTAFKTISMRIRGAKTELEEAGLETDGMVESTAKLREEILALTGVDIMDGANQFKSTYAIMDELAAKWQDLTDIQQATVTELIAGKRQGNIVSSLMTNFDTAREALETSLDSSGSAMKEHEKWQKSLEAQINKLKASWQGLSQAFLKSDFLKGALDAVIGLVDGVTKLIDTLGTFPTLLSIFGMYQSFKGNGLFKPIIDEATGAAKGITNVFSDAIRRVNDTFKEIGLRKDGLFKTSIEVDKKALNEYSEMLKTTVDIDDNTFNKIFENASSSAKEFAKSGKLAAEGVDVFVNSQKAAQVATLAQNKSLGNASAIIREYYSGCKNVQMGQEDFLAAVRQTNPELANVISNSKNGASAMMGYTKTLVGAKAASTALKVASMALNAVLSYGIGILISYAVEGIMKWINAADELSDKVDEIISKFKEEHDALLKLKGDYDTANESSMISKYEKLSKGVDGLGKNVSLTAEEYSEYQSIVNTIADQIPSLIAGYDEQGNAILGVKGNVEGLVTAYENLIKAQNNEVLKDAGNIRKDFQNVVDEAEEGTLWNTMFGTKMTSNEVAVLEKIYNSDKTDKKYKNNVSEILLEQGFGGMGDDDYDPAQIKRIVDALKDAGADISYTEHLFSKTEDVVEHIAEIAKENPEIIKSIIDDFNSTLEAETDGMKGIVQSTLSNAFDISDSEYYDMSDTMKAVAYNIANSFDYDFFKGLEENGTNIVTYINDMLDQLNTIDNENGDVIETAFNLKTQFNGGEIDYGEYVNSVREANNLIDSLNVSSDIKSQLKLALNTDEVIKEYDALVKRLTSKEIGWDDKTAKNFLNSLSAEEFAIAMDIIPELDAGATIEQVRAMIEEEMATEFKFDIAIQVAGIEAFNTALSEARSATGLTAEAITALKGRYEDLEGFNAEALFERTANGVRLNNEELARLETQYENVNKLDIKKNLNTLIGKYKELTEQIENGSYANEQEKETLQANADAYADKIEELRILESQYDGLTSAFSKWQQAQSSPNDGDNYDSIFESLEALQESYKTGLVGTDDFRAAVQLMSNEDLSTASVDKLVSAYKDGLPKMKRYFTEGQKGCKNFLNDVNKLNSEWAHLNEKGEWEIDINVEEAAEKLNMDVSTIYLILDKLKDYGFEINIDDTSLENLQTDIEKCEAKVKELGQTPIPINLDATDIKTIDSEISKIKAHINEVKNDSSINVETKTAQLDEARVKLEALIQKKQEASQPAYMNLNASQVNASLVEALEKVQAYQNAINEVNKLSELKEAGITIDDSQLQTAKEKVDECAKAIQGLDGEVKMAIGLEEDGSIDSIKKSFEEGKVKIDADTDPALTKIEQLAENVERIEDKDVTINVTVNGLDDVKELNKQIDLAADIDGDINRLSEYVESAKALKELGENVSSYITAEIKGNVIDEFEYKIDNLKVFSDSAKDLEEIGFVKSEVTADIKGNVTDEFEYKIDNLKVFTDSAKDIHKIGNVESNVKATINSGEDGDVVDEFEYKLNNLGEFAEHVKKLQGLGDVDISVKATINSGDNGDVIDEFEYKLDNLSEFANHVKELQGLQSVDISVNASVNTGENGDIVDTFEYKLNNLSKFADYVRELQGLENIDVSVNATVNTGSNGDAIDEFEYKLNNLEVFAQGAKELQGVGNVSSEITAKVNTGESGDAVDTFEYKLNNLKTFAEGAKALQGVGNVSSTVTAEINSGSDGDVVDEFEYKLNNLEKFAQYAKDLQGVGSVDVSVSAKVNTGKDGDVTDTFEYKLNNLDEFASYAKELQGLEDVNITIKANVKTGEDSATNEWEYRLNNLNDFVSYAKDLQGLESVDITVSANAKGNVVGEKTEGKINNLEVFAKGVKGLDGLESKEITITANAKGNVVGKKTESKINNLEVFAVGAKKVQGLSSKDITITANAKGNVVGKKTESKINNLEVFAKGAKSLQGISSKEVNITANADGNVVGDKTEGKINNLKVFGNSAKALNGVESKKVSITADANGNVVSGEGASSRLSSLTEFKSLISGMSNQTVTVSVTANVDSANINQAITLLQSVATSGVFKDYTATVQVGAKIATIDDTTVKNYKAPPKDGKVSYSVDPNSSVYTWTAPSKDGTVNYEAEVEALTYAQRNKTGTITYKAKVTGFPVVNGTANANGTAFTNGTSGKTYRQGDWGVKQTTTALTGELGQELVVYGNRYWTVGDNGAEFATIPKGAIVFNHKQTEELFKNGRVTSDGGRGRALVEGTAFKTGKGSGKFYNSSTGESYDSKDDDKNSKEVLDWIEVIIDRVERAIDKFEQQANNIYKSWSSRNKALQDQISEVSREIGIQEQAYDEYMDAANNVGLSDKWKKKVQSGKIDIESIKDETLKKKIDSYQQWYEKALACKDKIEELKETESKLYAQRFENVQSEYDGILQGYEHTETMLNEYISQAEEKGHIVSKNYYQALINNEKSNISQLKKEQKDLIKARDEAVASGKIEEDSEEWHNMCAEIDGVTQRIEEGETSLLSYARAMEEIDWSIFDLLQERISNVTSEADFLIELMSNDKMYDDNGKLTSQGLATMALHGQNYNTHMYQADDYGAEIARLNKQIKKDPYDQELINRRNELIEKQRESILAAEDEKQAIKDLVEEGIEVELDALQELIDKKNEELESERDLYEYSKKVKEQAEEIADIEKMLSAYSGDDSEESKAKIQELKVSLEDAKENLKETEWDKYISDTSALLDKLYTEYELTLNTRIGEVNELLEQVVDGINAAMGIDGTVTSALGENGAIASAITSAVSENGSIKSILNTEATSVGTTLSTAMNNIWSVGEGNAKSILTTYGKGFQDKQTTTNTVLGNIKADVSKMIADLNKESAKNVDNNKTKPSAKADPTKNGGGGHKPTTTKKSSSSGDGKPKVGDKVKFESGQYYYDSQGKKPLGSKNKGKYVYITKISNESWSTHPIHISTGKKLGSGDLGWLKKSQISGYATGKKDFLNDEIAWTQEGKKREFIIRPSDGAILTPIAKGDSVLNAAASGNIWNMANSPAEFIKDNLNLGATNVPNNSTVSNNITQHFENINFNMPNVHGYNDLLREMQSDPKFEKLVLSMTVDRIAGRSKLAKGKSIR